MSTDGQLFTIIGGDGGLLEYPVKRDRLVLAPGERTDAIVIPRAAPGAELVVRSLLYNRGYGSVEARTPFDDLFTITMADLPPYTGGPLPETRRSIEPLSTSGATTIDIQLTLGQLRDGSFEYRINGEPFARDKPVQAMPGETQVWTVTNKTNGRTRSIARVLLSGPGRERSPVRRCPGRNRGVPFEKTARFVVRFAIAQAGGCTTATCSIT